MKKPNILMVVVDQLRLDCVGFAGAYPVKTPNIDCFAADATWFSHAFTPIPLCCPARQSMLTGKRPESLGNLWNYDLGSRIPPLDPGHWTWTEALAGAGYAMSYVGKWHVSPDHDPRRFGFESYVAEADYIAFRDRKYPTLAYRNGYFGEDEPLPLEDSQTHWLTARAIEAMERHHEAGKPWLVRLDLPEPHLPCRPVAPFAGMFGPGDVPRWASFPDSLDGKPYIQRQQLVNWGVENFTWDDWAPVVARYYNVIAQVDHAFGLILAALERCGGLDDTIVIFTSDHGDMCGAHGMMDKHYVLYDDIVRVPFVMRLPGQRAAIKSDAFVYNALDIGPTLMEAAGLTPPDGLHGRSLMPLLEGRAETDRPREAVVSTYNGQQFGLFSQRMLRERDWKYVWNATDVDELYDLAADPAELVNLAGAPEQAERLARMRRALFHALIEAGDTLVDNQWLSAQLLQSRKVPPPAAASAATPIEMVG